MAQTYLTILFSGIIAVGLYNIISGILRGFGNTVFPLITLLLTSVLNVVLDIWFVAGLNLGIAGVAIATVISRLCLRCCIFKLTL